MTWQTNRNTPAAKAIDDYQDSISDPNVRVKRSHPTLIVVLAWVVFVLAVVNLLIDLGWIK